MESDSKGWTSETFPASVFGLYCAVRGMLTQTGVQYVFEILITASLFLLLLHDDSSLLIQEVVW